MSSTREQIPPRRKRQRTEAGLLDDLSESQPSKRQKPSTKLHSAEFYDSLSKVWLTRRALKELDRRTSQANSTQQPTFTPRRITRNTSNKIQRFARDGGLELCDLRGYPAPRNVIRTMSSNYSSRSKKTKSTVPTSLDTLKTKRSSAYNKDFEQHIIDHGIYPEGYNYPDRRTTPEPALEELRQRLAQPRPSLSPSRWPDSKFKDFKQKNARVINEGDVMRDVVPIMCGDADILSKQDLLFTRLDPIANDTTVDAKPDFYDGARLEDIDKQVRKDLGSYIIPTGHTEAPVAPNFFLEVKRPSGGADVAKRQACYNGAIGARAMHKLQSYGQGEPVYDGSAYTITTTYHAGTLNMYTTHLTQAEDGTTEYHMSQVDGWNTLGNPDTCRRGFTALRNSRDWTREQRDAFISAANERARTVNTESPPFESFDDNDGSDPIGVQNVSYLTQAKNSEDDRQYYMSQPQEEYLESEQSTLESYGNNLSNEQENPGYIYSESSTFDSSKYNSQSEMMNMRPIQESETSANELALDVYATPTIPSKRRHKSSEQSTSKAPRKSDGRSGRRGSKR